MRNQNIYSSRLTQGIVLGSYGNSKPLAKIDRTFSIFIENTVPEFDANNLPKARVFHLTLEPAVGVSACFEPFDVNGNCSVASKDVTVYSLSRVALTVYAKASSSKIATIKIMASNPDPGLQASLLLNPDPTNPEPFSNLNTNNGASINTDEVFQVKFEPFTCADFESLPPQVLVTCKDQVPGPVVDPVMIQWPNLLDSENPALLNPALLNTTRESGAIESGTA